MIHVINATYPSRAAARETWMAQSQIIRSILIWGGGIQNSSQEEAEKKICDLKKKIK